MTPERTAPDFASHPRVPYHRAVGSRRGGGRRTGVRARLVVLALTACALAAPQPVAALRIVNYNITNYPSVNGAGRNPHFRTILSPLSADIVVVQEIQSQAGVDGFRDNVLNALEPGQWAAAPFFDGNDTDNALFYKPSSVQFLGAWPFYPNPANLLRYVVCYRLKPAGYGSEGAEIRVYSQHLKASTSSAAQRLAEAIGIRDSMNAMPPGTHAILLGDFNIYSGNEAAFLKFKEVQTGNIGRLYDPLNAPAITWNTASLSAIHTQSPCATCPSGFATGGIDDRFDMFLPTLNMKDGEGWELLPATYIPVGNDGMHYDLNITDAPTIPEGAGYATALWNASDHLPIRVDLQVPSRLSAPATLAFGAVIHGAGAGLAISNTAPALGDDLDYTLSAGAGFTAPAGAFSLLAGGTDLRMIGLAAGAAGPRAAVLSIASDAPDSPAFHVALSADVFDHASASLDSTTALLFASLDFGDRPAGAFSDLPARVHNRGYSPWQAALSLESATITGGAGRFSIVGGFQQTLVAGEAATHSIRFDDTGATSDSTYEALLRFTSADEPLPGGIAQPDLDVALRARVTGGTVGVGRRDAFTATRLHAPYPNPLARSATFAFDLARAGQAQLDVFDLGGRRVATVARGDFAAGAHAVRWDGRDDAGRKLAAGLYFVRLSASGATSRTVRLAVTTP